MVISGGQEYIYAPHKGETVRTAPFRVEEVGSGKAAEVVWEIVSSSPGAVIGADGVVSIDDTYTAGDINGTDIVIRAAVKRDGSETPETVAAVLHVREAQKAVSFEIVLPQSVRAGEGTKISLGNCTDQYGEPMDAPRGEVKWAFSSEMLSVRDGRLWALGKAGQEVFAAVFAGADDAVAEKRFIVTEQENYIPDAETLKKLAGADIKIINKKDALQCREVDAGAYVYVKEALTGAEELEIDTAAMVNAGKNTKYQVTVRRSDGSIYTEDRRADGDGKLRLFLKDASAAEVSPVLGFSLGNCSLGEAEGYFHVSAKAQYTGREAYGFRGAVSETEGGVSLGDGENFFAAALPDGFYRIKITKPLGGTGRSTVKINGASQGTNVGNQGTGGREGIHPYTYLMEDVYVEGGTARLSLEEKDFTLASVEIRRAPQIVKRRVHIYLGGDSTVSNYYPIEEEEPRPGRFQTGWGQVFGQYVTGANAVTNLAGGGTYAKSWYEMAFPGVLQNGQPGDYFILQAGINDRTYSSQEEMAEYLTRMINACREKGIIIILATAMQCPKFWKDRNGREVGEYGRPEGSGLAPFMDVIRKLAEEKEVFLVDTGRLTGEWYERMGRTYVMRNYHLYNVESGVEEDTLHLSYHGAMKIAELIATELAHMRAEGKKDGLGNTLEGLSFHETAEYEAAHVDAMGGKTFVKVTGIRAVYRRYGE